MNAIGPRPAPLILSVFSTFAVGGPQVRFLTLANSLGRAFRHAIVTMDGATECAARLRPDLDVTWPEVAIRKGDTLGNAWRFRDALHRIRPDMLVTYNWGTIEWALANSVLPVVPHLHVEDGFGPEEQSRQIPRRVLMRRAVLRRCDLVVPSRTLHEIASRVWKLPERRLVYVPNGVDLSRFAPGPGTGREEGHITIGTVASLRAEKNIARLLRAVRRMPSSGGIRLVVVGDGPERAGLESLAQELGLDGRVHFAGEAPDPAELYRSFDVFALSSDTEQMPLSVLEAMASGLPVAATDVGDVRHMLAEENGPFVVARDEEALAGALARLAEAAPLRRRIGAANRAKAERDYDEKSMIETYRRLFDGAGALAMAPTG